MKIAILGGGISGLSAAYFLSKYTKKRLSITVFEQSERLGGWISTSNHGNCVFEHGPHTLRPGGPSGLSTLELIYDLGLVPELVCIPRNSPVAMNRFIYSHSRLLNLNPSMQYATDTKLRSLALAFATEAFRPAPISPVDETVEAFLKRRFGSETFVDVFSGILHGIYAGDISKLSVNSTFPALKKMETDSGSLVKNLMELASQPPSIPFWQLISNDEFSSLVKRMNTKISVYTFQRGLQTLVEAIKKDLDRKGVQFIFEPCVNLDVSALGNQVKTNRSSYEFDAVLSALPSHSLANIIENSQPHISKKLRQIPWVTVGVVNLRFKRSKLPVDGFGYLFPKSEYHGVLGVLFDSLILPAQSGDDVVVTVMLGGHFWDNKNIEDSAEFKSQILQTSIETVTRDLNLDANALLDHHVTIHRSCIPQYVVGHEKRLQNLHEDLELLKTLGVLGSSYRGVGINDVIRNSLTTSLRLLAYEDSFTGLENDGL